MAARTIRTASVSGLRIDGSIPGVQLGFTFSPTIGIVAKNVDKLGLDIRSFREPLKRAIQQVVIPSIRTNFDSGGRPAWEPLSEATIRWRQARGIGGTAPLIATGALRRTMGFFNIWDVNRDRAVLKQLPDRVWYGALHQSGHGVSSSGSGGGGFTKFLKGLHEKGGRRRVSIPARPFVVLQPEDYDDIEKVFANWLDERIARSMGVSI